MSNSNDGPDKAVGIPKEWTQFSAFIETHYRVIYSVALAHVRDGEVAQEIAQDVCVRLLLERDSLPPLANAGGWLARVARNTAIDWVRRRQTHSRILAKMEAMNFNPGGRNSPPDDARTAATGEEERRRLFAALELVEPETREMLLLHFCDGIEKQKIARLLEVHPSTVGRRMDDGLRALRKLLGCDDVSGLRSLHPAGHTARNLLGTLAVVAGLSAADKAALAAVAAPLPVLGAGVGVQQSAPSLLTHFKNLDWSSLMKSKSFLVSSAIIGAAILTSVMIDRNSNADFSDTGKTVSTPAVTIVHAQDMPVAKTRATGSVPIRKFELSGKTDKSSNDDRTTQKPAIKDSPSARLTVNPYQVEVHKVSESESGENRNVKGQVLDDVGNPVFEAQISSTLMTQSSLDLSPSTGRLRIASQPTLQMSRDHSDKDGFFKLKILDKTSETLMTVTHEGFAMHLELLQLPVEDLVIRLRRPYTYVAGKVIDMQTKAPVPYASLTFMPKLPEQSEKDSTTSPLSAGGTLKTKADENGEFEMDLLPEGPFSLDVTSTSGLRLAPVNSAIYTTGIASASVPLVMPDIEMYPGYTIQGQVRDFSTKQPIAGAEVGFVLGGGRMGGAKVEPVFSDERGYYVLKGANPIGDRDAGPDALQFLFLSANATGYRSNTARPKIDRFDINQLVITQDIELSPGTTSNTVPLGRGRFIPTPR